MLAKSQQDSHQVVLEVRPASSWLISNTVPYFADLSNMTRHLDSSATLPLDLVVRKVPRRPALMFLPPTRPSSTILLRNLYGCVLLGWHVLLIHRSLVRTRLNEPKCCEQAMHCEQTIF
ncbi:hypothetical protein T11_491 [Trichinella zimbabwensis]|uniref:Uncharacterized protein n=1 Tax=Trichinella zimbabwensis TaxID=268475 RepID=A0A0V1GNP6_9BILA|nr:hypothetical protein T11_491 [Trichinella zimbabwensis]